MTGASTRAAASWAARLTEIGSPALRRSAAVFAPALAIQLLQLVVYPMPLGTWVFGVVLGLLAALFALGMALIYRVNRILNFAQGDLGTVPTVLAVGLIAFSHVGYRPDDAFKLAGSVFEYDAPPGEDRPPSYPSPRRGG